MNPWFLEQLGNYERDRIQRDLKQIRLEKEALRNSYGEEKTDKAGLPHRSLLRGIVAALVRFLPLRIYARKTVGFSGDISPCRR
jgi:hypothetical protein